MKRRIVAIGILAAAIVTPRMLCAQGAGGQSLAETRARFENALNAARSNRDTSKTRLSEEYAGMIKAAEKSLQDRGELEGVIAIRAEKDRFQKDLSVPNKDAAGDNFEVVNIRQKYRERVAKLSMDQARETVALFQKYTNSLSVLKKQLTRDNKIDEALETQKEESSAAKIEQVAAALATVRAAEALAAAKAGATGADGGAPGQPGTGASLDGVKLDNFQYSDWELNSPVNMLNRFIAEVYPKGIKVRILAMGKLKISGVSMQDGVPRYWSNSSSSYDSRGKSHDRSGRSAKAVLDEMCEKLGVVYRIDSAKNEVIIDEKAPVAIAGAAADTAKLLDSVKIDAFEFTSWEISSPGGLLNRFVAAVYPKGIGVVVDAPKLGVSSVWYEGGMPRYSIPYRYSNPDGNESRAYNASGLSAGDVLRAMCTVLGLGYKIDPAGKGVVIVDSGARDAQWSSGDVRLPDIIEALKTEATKKSVIGKTIMLTGNVTRPSDGLQNMTVDLDNSVRLVFPKDETNKTQYDTIKAKYTEVEASNKSSRSSLYKAEVTVMGEVGATSTSRAVVLEKCRVLSLNSRYTYASSSEIKKAKQKRLGEK